jgi:hypothetical protein
MRIEALQIELRPRTNAQALDLGFALLRSHAGAAYMAFFALWIPLLALCAVLTVLWPELASLWMLLAWWCKPLLERAPLYVLSRQVFGTAVTWQEAVRAWPRQLGGGWFRLLTWGRVFAAGRGLQQPVWMLEHARGKVASARLRVLGKNSTAQSAFWFGIVCAHLEAVLEIGMLGFIGIFISDSGFTNPFAALTALKGAGLALLMLALYGLAAGIMAPIYTACGFTLYLNRRASLEAWDLEIQLRQIRPPVAGRSRARAAAGSVAAVLLAVALALPPDASAAPAAAPPAAQCKPPDGSVIKRGADNGARQAQLRRQLDQVYADPDLRGYQCVESWMLKKPFDEPKDVKAAPPPSLSWLATVFKVLIIAVAIGAVGWLLYRYRDKFPALRRAPLRVVATEIGGLDIRAESLPADIAASVRALWARGERRAALALLYRATLSRLVTEDGLALSRGDTEGDCLRQANAARQAGRLDQGRLEVAVTATALWLSAAYADRWPDEAALLAACNAWQLRFGAGRERAA